VNRDRTQMRTVGEASKGATYGDNG
jgi:hypothetical protein